MLKCNLTAVYKFNATYVKGSDETEGTNLSQFCYSVYFVPTMLCVYQIFIMYVGHFVIILKVIISLQSKIIVTVYWHTSCADITS
jgi:hypothetical protein